MLENFFNLVDKYHQNRIVNFLKLIDFDNIIDVGSHKGEFLSYVLKLNKIKKVYAFEPQIEINKILKQKYIKNKNVEIFNIALDKAILCFSRPGQPGQLRVRTWHHDRDNRDNSGHGNGITNGAIGKSGKTPGQPGHGSDTERNGTLSLAEP